MSADAPPALLPSRSLTHQFVQQIRAWAGGDDAPVVPFRGMWGLASRYIVLEWSGMDADAIVAEVRTADSKSRFDARADLPGLIVASLDKSGNSARKLPVVLRVRDADVLVQRLKLPRLARRNPSEAIGFGIQRWTPFDPDEVISAAAFAGDAGDAHIFVEARYGLNAKLAPLIATLTEAGAEPDYLALGPEPRWFVPRPTAKLAKLKRRVSADMMLFGLAAALVLAALPTLYVRQALAIDELRGEIRTELRKLQLQSADRAEIERLKIRQDLVAVKSAELPRASTVIGSITSKIDNESWLESFALDGARGRVAIARLPTAKGSDGLGTDALLKSVSLQSTQQMGTSTVSMFSFALAAGSVK